MKYWQLSVCLPDDKKLHNQFLGNLDLIKYGIEEAPEDITLEALSKSNEIFFVLPDSTDLQSVLLQHLKIKAIARCVVAF